MLTCGTDRSNGKPCVIRAASIRDAVARREFNRESSDLVMTTTAVRISSLAALALMAVMSISAAHASGTPEQRRACRADAQRLCRQFIPDVPRITACMKANKRKLSPACRTQFR
jgi:type II secretory pathway component PulL